MFTVSVIVAAVALLLQSGYAVPSGAQYGTNAAGYGAGSYDATRYGSYDGQRYHGPQAIPVVLPDGHIADTHEVAAAKGAHFTAVAKAQATTHAAGYGSYYGGSYGSRYGAGAHGAGYGGKYAGGYGGYVVSGYGAGYAGTRYAGGYRAGVYDGAGYGYNTPYHGPIARPVVLPSGYLADTHDVAANKAVHLSALTHASHSHASWTPYGSHGYH